MAAPSAVTGTTGKPVTGKGALLAGAAGASVTATVTGTVVGSAVVVAAVVGIVVVAIVVVVGGAVS